MDNGIRNEFVVQYGYKSNQYTDEMYWDDEGHAGRYSFEAMDEEGESFAHAAALAYARYCDYIESKDEPDFRMTHRVIHRITSDLVAQ